MRRTGGLNFSAFHIKLRIFRFLNDTDDGVSESMIPFAVQYLNVLKVCFYL